MATAELWQMAGFQILLVLPALFFLVRASQAKLPSRRLANLALACGLSCLIVPERLLQLSEADYPRLFVSLGVVRLVVGLAGLVLAIAAYSRRSDGGVGSPRLLFATVLSLLPAVLGATSLVSADRTRVGPPQVYAAPDGSFRITLPSSKWQETKVANTVVAFTHTRPQMLVKVRTVSRDKSRNDFDNLAQLMIERIDSVPRLQGKLEMEDGTAANGNHYRYFSGIAPSSGGVPGYMAYSVVWSPRTGLLVETSFDGVPESTIGVQDSPDLETMKQSARQICLSLE